MLRTLKVPYDAKRARASAMWHQWLLKIVCHQVLPSKDEASRCGGWFSVTHIHHSILHYTILYCMRFYDTI